jgi:antitoxin ParD1/3/4
MLLNAHIALFSVVACAMNVSVGERREGFIDRVVQQGRYGWASEVVREGLRLVEEREAKLQALRAMLDASFAAGGVATDEEIDAALREKGESLRKNKLAS